MEIYKKLESIRKQKKLSRKNVAEKCFVSISLINEIENGRTRLSLDMFIKFCEIYEISPTELLKDDYKKYFILENEDIEKINNAIQVLNKIKSQINETTKPTNETITIGNNNNIKNRFNKR